MKKYYGITSIILLAFALSLLFIGIWKTCTEALHNSWFYFVAFVFATLLFVRRYLLWRKTSNEKLRKETEN